MEPAGYKSKVELNAVLADYFRRLDAGEMIDREEFLAIHPKLADDLRAYFQQEEQLWRAARPAETVAAQHTPTPGQRLEVRCPHCHSPQELAVDAPLTDLTCGSCGSHFSLVDPNKATWEAPSLSTMGRFELVERLGVGGFGSVWKARDKQLDRAVAIKIPRQADMTTDEQEKFFREARAAAQLRHPNIVSVHEVGRDGDSVYIVSDFVRGITLGDWLTGQQLTSREAAAQCAKIAYALHHAHEQGVVHRDLKPANIIIDGDGQPHLMDFGLARRDVGEVTVTMDGQVLGTPAYMSPEQAQGEAHTADRRSDVYSLGVILFQLLTGELPFRGNARMIMHQVIHDEPPSPRTLNANVPRDLETITLKCLQKEPERRYLSTEVLASDLRLYLKGMPIAARPVGRMEIAWRWCKRNRGLAASFTAFVLTLTIGVIVATLLALRSHKERLRADERTQYAIEQEAIAQRNATEAAERADEAERMALYLEAESALQSRRYRRSYELNQRLSGNRWEYGYQRNRIVDACMRERRLVARLPVEAAVESAAFVDNEVLVFQVSGQVRAYSLEDEKILASRNVERPLQHVTAYDDEHFVAVIDDKVHLLQLPNLNTLSEASFPEPVQRIMVAPGEDRIAICGEQGLVRVLSAKRFATLAEHRFDARDHYAFSHDGETIVALSPNLREVWNVNLKTVKRNAGWVPLIRGEFVGRGDQLVGTQHEQALSTFYYLRSLHLGPSGVTLSRKIRFIRGVHLTGTDEQIATDFFSADAVSENHGARIADVYNEGPNLIDTAHPEASSYYRFEDLWPHLNAAVAFLAVTAKESLIATLVDGDISIFRLYPVPLLREDRRPILGTLPTAYWNCDASSKYVFSCETNRLHQCSFAGDENVSFLLEQPQATSGMNIVPFYTCVTRDGQRAAVLWQEWTGGGSAPYGRKLIAVYDLAASAGGKPLPIKHLIHPARFDGTPGRSLKWMALSSDGEKLTFGCRPDNAPVAHTRIYELQSSKAIGSFTSGELGIFSQDRTRLATYISTSNGSIHIYQLATGKLLSDIAPSGRVRRVAFSTDNTELYVGYYDHRIVVYDVDTAKPKAEMATGLAPVIVMPEAGVLIAFRYSGGVTGGNGSLEIAALDTGRTIRVLSRTFWHFSRCVPSGDGRAFAAAVDRNIVTIFRSMSGDEAVDILSRPLGSMGSLAANYTTRGRFNGLLLRRSERLKGCARSHPGMIDLARRYIGSPWESNSIPTRQVAGELAALYRIVSRGLDNNEIAVDPHLLNELAWNFAAAPVDEWRQGDMAINLATKACELTSYENANFIHTLAAAYAETGDFDTAIRWSTKALELLGDSESDSVLRKEFLSALENYKANRPTRQPSASVLDTEGASEEAGEPETSSNEP